MNNPFPGRHILVVEDEPILAFLLEETLADLGYAVVGPIRGTAGADVAVFLSRKGGALDPSAVHRIVKDAAKRAGLSEDVSAHWLRHAHASHSLDCGVPIHLVQATLGYASVATTGRYTRARPTDSSARYLGI